jgi:hypothetical protein
VIVIDVTDETFQTESERSLTVPVIIDPWAEGAPKQLGPILRSSPPRRRAWVLAKVTPTPTRRSPPPSRAEHPDGEAVVRGQPVTASARPEAQARDWIRFEAVAQPAWAPAPIPPRPASRGYPGLDGPATRWRTPPAEARRQ